MFLFENYQYDYKWASEFYEDYYDASKYLGKYLNANSPFSEIRYVIKHAWSSDHINNQYIAKYVKIDGSDMPIHKKYFAYMYDKLDSYGTAINITHTAKVSNKIEFKYNIEYDSERWDIEHKKYEYAFNSDEILNCRPTIDQWIYMFDAKIERKNPNILFRKEKSIENVAAKYIIAIQLNWNDAAQAAFEKISTLLVLPENIEKYSSMFKKFIKCYARQYIIDDQDIINMIEDFKQGDKHCGETIPIKNIIFAKQLDNNMLVKKYQCIGQSEIQIMTINDNVGSITIEEDLHLGRGFYRFVLHLKGQSYHNDKRTHSYRYKALVSTIDSVVNAIYKNDPDELDKIIIKVK